VKANLASTRGTRTQQWSIICLDHHRPRSNKPHPGPSHLIKLASTRDKHPGWIIICLDHHRLTNILQRIGSFNSFPEFPFSKLNLYHLSYFIDVLAPIISSRAPPFHPLDRSQLFSFPEFPMSKLIRPSQTLAWKHRATAKDHSPSSSHLSRPGGLSVASHSIDFFLFFTMHLHRDLLEQGNQLNNHP
jgi:hypothetical protein